MHKFLILHNFTKKSIVILTIIYEGVDTVERTSNQPSRVHQTKAACKMLVNGHMRVINSFERWYFPKIFAFYAQEAPCSPAKNSRNFDKKFCFDTFQWKRKEKPHVHNNKNSRHKKHNTNYDFSFVLFNKIQ